MWLPDTGWFRRNRRTKKINFTTSPLMDTHIKTPISITRKEVVIVKPEKPTPSHVLSLSTIDNDYNLEIICQSVYVYKRSCTLAHSNGSNAIIDEEVDPAIVIKDAISKLLVYCYPLAGKLKRGGEGKLQITCDGEGVPFLEANANCELSSLHYLDGIDVDTAKLFVFDFPSKSEFGYYPLMFQVTKFTCGSFTIGMGLSHSVCDGFGAGQVYRAMAELASGKFEPSVKPVWERERLVGKTSQEPLVFPVDKVSIATSPYLPSNDILHDCFYVNGETIKRLKMSLTQKLCGVEDFRENFTTLEVLAAYVWRSRFRAFKLNHDGKTMLCLAMGIRHLLNPPLPTGYYGNAFVPANTVLTGSELDEMPLSRVAKLIKDSKKLASCVDNIWNQINNMEKLIEMNIKVEVGSGASVVLTDWRQLQLIEEVDFGWQGSVNMIPVPWNMFGYIDLCIFLPPSKLDPSMKGGVRILVSLPRAVMAKFKEEMHALLQFGNNDDAAA